MPKENKQRGRREKRKRETKEEEVPSKRPKAVDEEEQTEASFIGIHENSQNERPLSVDEDASGGIERPFYGMLEDEDQEYFRTADEILEKNDPDTFPTEGDRALFVQEVYRRAEGQELKIANSQSCSRLMERLILLSTVDQKKKLFEKFSGNFPHLIQHRFASHCCETLFINSAPIVTEEIMADSIGEPPVNEIDGSDQVFVSMENLFLYTLNELEGSMAQLLTDRHASHALRVLLIVLSGQPLAKTSTKSLLQSRKKEKITIEGYSVEADLSIRTVPESFQHAIQKIISDTVAGLDTTFIHVLAKHPTGNPTLQLLLELELTQQGKSKGAAASTSIISKLMPDDIAVEGSESAVFINGLMYEQIGSRLLETVITFAPGKLFKQIYRSTFKERIGSLARNEIASFVVIKVLERLSKDDLEEAVKLILPQVPGLIERNRTTVIRTMLERCQARKAYKTTEALSEAIVDGYGNDPTTLIIKMTQFKLPPSPPEDESKRLPDPRPTPEATHGSLLAQAMLTVPNKPTTLIQNSLLTLPAPTLLGFALQTYTSHILQSALTPTESNLAFRRKLTNTLIASTSSLTTPGFPNTASSGIISLALSKPGSHTLDALFRGTTGLISLKERIASILTDHEMELRDNQSGRVVWRNWMCDLYKKNRGEWVGKCKAGEGGAGGGPVTGKSKIEDGYGVKAEEEASKSVANKATSGGVQSDRHTGSRWKKQETGGKSAIELARERFATNKAGGGPAIRGKAKAFRPTGANGAVVKER